MHKNKKLFIDIKTFLIITIIVTYGTLITLSASEKNIHIITQKLVQVAIGVVVMIISTYISARSYKNSALVLYFICLILLILVEVFGETTNGAKRWLNIGIIRFQPSEISKISIPLLIAKVVNQENFHFSSFKIILLFLIILFPVFLISLQPDLGTSILIAISGFVGLFFSGINWKIILSSITFIFLLLPVFWIFFMHDYQKNRIITLFNPEIDPFGSGYHIIQSKIAIGSGGLFGKGLFCGTQSQLNFLPERHTDFIFAVLAEETGFVGVLFLIFLYLSLTLRWLIIATKINSTFGKIVISNFMTNIFICVFINIGMVSGLLPIVGTPLPLVSYGGSSFVITMIKFGIVTSIHKNNMFYLKR
ncbi:rod shape-determining protein RodA [Candidatus Riesia sp. GBBU]|nr:rod shape-determining protein RodA [Candidatus Riesia sp. GBBU]